MVNLPGLPIRVVEEVISAVPALVDRTRSQLELTQHLLEKLPCSPLHRGTAAESSTSREATQDAAGNEGAHATVTDIRSHQNPAPADADVEDQTVPDASEVATPELPVVTADEVAIPDYDSLAASQVVPRLASMEPAELALVLVYEQSHRARQTIINRVRQLQAASDGN